MYVATHSKVKEAKVYLDGVVMQFGDEPSPKKGRQSKDRRRPDGQENKMSETAATTMTPQTNRQRKQIVADKDPPSNLSDDNKQKTDKPTKAVAASGRRGRPKKEETTGVSSAGVEDKGATGKGEDKAQSRPKEGEATSPMFSPRRSGRSVVPNSRFKDMELDFGTMGRKRSKEDTADTPVSKRVKMSAKKQSPEKGKNSPVKRATTAKASVRLEPDVKPVSTASTTASRVQSVSAAVSPPVVTASSPRHTATSPAGQTSVVTATSPRHTASLPYGKMSSSVASVPLVQKSTSATSAILPKQVNSTTSVTGAVSGSPPASVTSVSSPQLSLASANSHSQSSSVSTACRPVSALSSPSAASTGMAMSVVSSGVSTAVVPVIPTSPEVSVCQLVSTSTSSSVTTPLSPVTFTVTTSDSGITASTTALPAFLFQSSPQPEETVMAESSGVVLHDKQTPSALLEASNEKFTPAAFSQSVVQQSQVTDADMTLVADLTDTAEVEIVDEPEQGEDDTSDVVTVTTSSHCLPGQKNNKIVVETPGRVVAKTSLFPTSKTVLIVRPSQAESSSDDQSPHKPSLLSTALSEAYKLATTTTIQQEAGVGDVMSIVELSPNKKVPVVLAERKEHGGKVVKFISSSSSLQHQQVEHLPASVQKILASKFSPTSSGLKEGSVSLLQQQRAKSVTVHIATPSQSPAGSIENSSRKEDNIINQASHTDQESSETQAASVTSAVKVTSYQECKGSEADAKSMVPTQAFATTSTVGSMLSSENDSSEGSEEDEDEEDGREGSPSKEKYVTSGTQTPYTKNFSRKVITVHVHPPSKDGEKNTEIVTVTRGEKEDPSINSATGSRAREADDVQSDGPGRRAKFVIVDLPEGAGKQTYVHCPDGLDAGDSMDTDDEQEGVPEEGKEGVKSELKVDKKYIIVDLPEGTTIKQPYARRTERIDSDPDFYTMDEKGLFTCNICQYQTYRRPNFYKHKKKHLGLRPYSCDQCSYRAATTSNLKRHQEIHKDIRNHKCPICNLFFRQKIHLERHIKYRHEEKKVRCPLCDYVCANENPDLKVHIKRRHIPQMGGSQEVLNAFKCRQCGIVANSKKDLRQHLKFHSKGPELKLFCNMCSFVTDCESRLRRHQYIHTKEKPFQCGLCDYRGSQKEHVLRHMRTQHNIEIERKHRIKKAEYEKGAEGEATKGSEKVDYTSDEKIFACNHCNMKFSKLINLYKHLHTQHRDIMPAETEDFSCVVCDFRTSNKKNLLVHMRRHNVTDQSPPSHVYSCVLCRYMNPKRRNLFQHMRKKHHIDIVIRDDGSSSCYMSTDPVSIPGSGGSNNNGGLASGQSLTSVQQMGSQGTEPVVSVLPLTDLISTVTQPSEFPTSAGTSTITMTTATVPATIKMEDLALVVSNPHTAAMATMATPAVGREGMGIGGTATTTLVDASGVEAFTIGTFSQDDAAEAIQGLQALAHRGVLDSSTIVEEQVQVMGSDDQTTLVIDPTGLSVVDQLVQPKAEPLQVVEIDSTHILDHDPSASHTSLLAAHPAMLTDTTTTPTPLSAMPGGDGSGFQLSAEQLMNLSTGDYLEINGEMFKVEVSTDGDQGQQIISFEPATPGTSAATTAATACAEDLVETLEASKWHGHSSSDHVMGCQENKALELKEMKT
ncbi:hypothetical protein ACOMHN_007867 [Nucella lapillus]